MRSAAPLAVDAVWRAAPLIELHWRDWGEDSVVLEARSGQLFQFEPLPAALMAFFEEAPQPLDAVIAQLAGDLGIAPDEEFRDTVLGLVQEFHGLGWLEPIIGS
jgi:hypothetical protein